MTKVFRISLFVFLAVCVSLLSAPNQTANAAPALSPACAYIYSRFANSGGGMLVAAGDTIRFPPDSSLGNFDPGEDIYFNAVGMGTVVAQLGPDGPTFSASAAAEHDFIVHGKGYSQLIISNTAEPYSGRDILVWATCTAHHVPKKGPNK